MREIEYLEQNKKDMKIGFYAGSFVPFTNGHLHVIKNASQLFDKVVVGIGINSEKQRRFDKALMRSAIEKVLIREKINNVEVIIYENLSICAALEHNSIFLIRGIRNGMDYEYEENLASINEEISGLDTIYVRAGKFGNLSSSMVVELLKNGMDVSKYLPEEILEIVKINSKN